MFYDNFIGLNMNIIASLKVFFYFNLLIFLCPFAKAIDIEQFNQICTLEQQSRSQFCRIYLGGALDAIAVLNDKAKSQNRPLYCVSESDIFDMERIIQFVQSQPSALNNKNAILPVVEFLKRNGGCE